MIAKAIGFGASEGDATDTAVKTIMIAAVAIMAMAFGAAPVESATVTVNCARGRTIAHALQARATPLTIEIAGTCHENVVIARDDVTLAGNPSGGIQATDPTQPTILLQSARRVVINSLTLSGGTSGVMGVQGAAFTLQNATVQGSSGNGVFISDSSSGVIVSSLVQNNQRNGIAVARASSARIGISLSGLPGPNMIQGNGGNGVSVFQASQALVDGNTIQNNSSTGIRAEGSSITITNNTIRGNPTGIMLLGATARVGFTDTGSRAGNAIGNNTVNGIEVGASSSAQIADNTIENNGRHGVFIGGGAAQLVDGNTIRGHGSHGLGVDAGGTLGTRSDEISGNTGSGIVAVTGASVTIGNTRIADNGGDGITVGTNSALRLLGSTISGNGGHGIQAVGDSVVLFVNVPIFPGAPASPPTITGNSAWGVLCDSKSSLGGDTAGVTGNTSGNVNCSGF